jgi:hypothetical protein
MSHIYLKLHADTELSITFQQWPVIIYFLKALDSWANNDFKVA